MYFSKSIIASAILALATATTTPSIAAGLATSSTSGLAAASTAASGASAAASTGASAGNVATHVIQVGGANGSLTFSPENVKAAVGDLVQFQFHPKNHSVIQSTFDKPCVPIQNVMPNMTTAFFSGYMPSNASAKVLTYTIRVMDAKPIWFYCGQAKHCQAGMVGAINAAATGNKTMSAFKALAATAPENLSPGQSSGSSSGSGTGSGSQAGSGTGSTNGGNAAQSSSAAGGAGGAGGAAAGAGSTSTGSGAPAQQTTNAAPSSFGSQSFFGLSLGAVAAVLLL